MLMIVEIKIQRHEIDALENALQKLPREYRKPEPKIQYDKWGNGYRVMLSFDLHYYSGTEVSEFTFLLGCEFADLKNKTS